MQHRVLTRWRLTLSQACRVAACARAQEVLGRAVCVDDLVADFDAEPALVSRCLREMVAREFVQIALVPAACAGRRCRFYVVSARWYLAARAMRRAGCLPGVCCVCGSQNAVAFPFLRRFFCRDCLMEVHRDDYKDTRERAGAAGRRAGRVVGGRPVRRRGALGGDGGPVPGAGSSEAEGGRHPARDSVPPAPIQLAAAAGR